MNNVRSTQKALAFLMAEGDAINEYCVVYGWNTNVTQQIRSPAESIFMWLLQSGASSQAKHGGAFFSAVKGSIEDPIAVPGRHEVTGV